ncbi:hypothetical protein [Paludisphaera borealis]|uniref:Uncharacterized protein n=1 Tax=Paludisphaera borealis TaxID=1387353 RepID=A0A1U7CNM6_9BACT|nr:hypothetical protein [Paludisphaera borealis]APW60540.1 hypothetical protein BSF38_02012 [Paludisphaera borealis]
MNDELYISDDGRFQMPSEALIGFIAYLRENEVPCNLEESAAFLSEGRPHGFGLLRHKYDIEAARRLYSTWQPGVEA